LSSLFLVKEKEPIKERGEKPSFRKGEEIEGYCLVGTIYEVFTSGKQQKI